MFSETHTGAEAQAPKEKEEKKEKQTSTIDTPVSEIYKMYCLDAKGKISKILIFCANAFTKADLHKLFSDTQLAYYETLNVDYVFCSSLLCRDDTVHTAKRKLVHELGNLGPATLGPATLDELYLFTDVLRDVDMNQVFKEATQNDTVPLTKERFFQYAINVGADPFDLELKEQDKEGSARKMVDPLDRDQFSYQDWSNLAPSGIRPVFAPLGLQFQDNYDYLFATNPYQMQLWTEPIRFEISPKNPLLSFENTLLLNYGTSTDIMVCFAHPVLEYASERGIDQEYMISLYFPFLLKRGISSIELLDEQRQILAEESTKTMTPGLRRYYDTVDTFYKIYWGRTVEIPYVERGIRNFDITLRPSDFKHSIPLDALFRTMHASKEMPFIKYNPGSRRENMYRLYSEKISANGKKIPYLPESVIMRLSRETGRGHQLSMYLKVPLSEQDAVFQDVYVHLDATSQIHITGELTTLMDADTLGEFLKTAVTPILDTLRGLLQSSGYVLRNFHSLTDPSIESARYTFQAVVPIEKTVKMADQMSYVSSVFDVISTDNSKETVLRFKRVENFREMDAQDALITQVYTRAGHSRPVIQSLIDNYQMTEEEAVLRVAKYSSEHQEFNGKILDNPGFPAVFRMQPLKNEMLIEIGEISAIAYIDVLAVYVDTVLRMTQFPSATKVSASVLQRFRKKVAAGQDAKPSVVPQVDNVVAPVGFPVTTELTKIQPLRFDREAEEGDALDDDEEGGLVFDEDYEYEEEADEGADEGAEEGADDGEGNDGDELVGGVGTPISDQGQVGDQVGDQGQDQGLGEEEELENYQVSLDGMSLKNPTPFFRKMQERDPVLFLTKKEGKFDLYSRACPSDVKRQPVILTDEEKARIDRTNPGSYEHAVQYGSNPKKKFWYICPRYWCLKTNSSISEADVKAGKCGAIIPPNEKEVPKGAYVYEFSHPKEHIDEKGNYIPHVPGFLKKDKHPNNLCIPCCFKKAWNSEDQIKRRAPCLQDQDQEGPEGTEVGPDTQVDTRPQKMITYIIGSVSYPLPVQRWGFLPMAVQLFLGTDNSQATTKQNAALIRPNTPCILRYGVEQSNTQSFVGCIAHFYAYKHKLAKTPSIADMRAILVKALSLDLFVQYQNGNLATIFRPAKVDQAGLDIDRYSATEFYKSIDIRNETQVDYLEDTIAAYENFVDFLQNDASTIDHTYLWDMVCDRNPLLLCDGVNLVILKMADDDVTEKVQMVCPSNAYSAIPYDPSKETVVLIKQGEFYEPVHLYEQIDTGEVVMKKAFLEGAAIQSIQSMLALIQRVSKKYCTPQPSMPRKYTFKRNLPVQDLIRLLKTYHYRLESQIVNYRNKTIGLRVNREEGQAWLFVPCFPSGVVHNLKIRYMDDDDLWLNYRLTRDRLIGIAQDSAGAIPCRPKVKVVDDGLVVGLLTETNQFVQIDPPEQNVEEDGIDAVYHSSYAEKKDQPSADTVLSRTKTPDKERVDTMRRISLETQFYNVFRSTVRMSLHEFEHRDVLASIQATVQDVVLSYIKKLSAIERVIKTMLGDTVAFQEFDATTLETLDTVMVCQVNSKGQCNSTTGPAAKYCLTMENDKGCKTVFPKRNLLSGRDNERVYFARLADELLRYRRIQAFMFQAKTYLNVTPVEYRVQDDELFLLETLLNRDYFRDLVPYNVNKHIQNIEYDTAAPVMAQTYSNEISLAEQVALVQSAVEKTEMSQYILDCIRETKSRVIGNDKAGSWRPVFPITAKEMVFGNTAVCSFIPMIYILQDKHKKMGISLQNVKTALWNGYAPLMEIHADKILSILRKQGKRAFMEKSSGTAEQKAAALERAIFNDEYFITDLDWWVLARSTKLPVILFSSTVLKHLLITVDWIRLGGGAKEPYYFVRSPADLRTHPIPNYHVVTPAYTFSELRSDVFVKAERGDPAYSNNMQTLDQYLTKLHILVRKP